MLMCVVSSVGLIKLSGSKDIVVLLYLSIFSPLSLAIVLVIVIFSAGINYYSTRFINLLHKKASWNNFTNPKLRKESQALANSCNSIGIQINSFYTIRKATVLTTTGCIFNSVINVLLAI
ncbi:unnamed protein product [Orchesella dallaii]|uniref:Uncharacterized protein n=1 Tax=Orchesella dallaii TaxID=48710 RepID=A0ABP1QY95_9HEXA